MSNDYSDKAVLLKCLAEDDLQAIAYLYTHSRKRLFIIAYTIVQDVETAQDIVQEFFADFLQDRQFENLVSLYGYMAQSIKNRALNIKKREATYLLIKQRLGRYREFIAPDAGNDELKEELGKAIANLPEMAAKVFTMHYVDNLSYDDISQKLGISKSTISSHMNRALKGLRSDLKKNL